MGSPVYHWAQVVPTHLTYRGKLFAEPRGRVEANNEPSQPRESRAGAALYWSKPEQSADQPSAAHAAHTGIKTDTKTDANKGENTDKIQIRFRYKIMESLSDTNRVTFTDESADHLSAGHTVIKHWELCIYRKMIVWRSYDTRKLSEDQRSQRIPHTQWITLTEGLCSEIQHGMTVLTLRQMLLQTMLFRPCHTVSSIRNFRACPAIPIFSSVKSNFILIKSPSPSSFPRLCQSSLSQEACNVSLVSVLQHPEYEGMKKKLEVEARSALDIACLHILLRWVQLKS